MSLQLSDTRVYEPQIRARLGTTAHFCRVVVQLKLEYAEKYNEDAKNRVKENKVNHSCLNIAYFEPRSFIKVPRDLFSLTCPRSHLPRVTENDSFVKRVPSTQDEMARQRSSHEEKLREREFCIDNLLVRIHVIILVIRWTGLAPWEFEFPFPGSLTSTFLEENLKAFVKRVPDNDSFVKRVQGYIAHKKPRPPRALQ